MTIFWSIYHRIQLEIPRKVMKIAIQLLDPMTTLSCLMLGMKKNSSNPEDLLRSTCFVEELAGIVRTEVQEHMNNKMNRNNYFLTSLTPHNSLFLL